MCERETESMYHVLYCIVSHVVLYEVYFSMLICSDFRVSGVRSFDRNTQFQHSTKQNFAEAYFVYLDLRI